MFDLHRHDEYSTFDGFGKAKELVDLCIEYGYKSLSTTNHGNTNGLIQTYKACKEKDLKAILGVEGYFLPKYKEQNRGYHLILIAKNLNGYGNLNRIQTEGEKIKYYNPIWTFDMLEKYHEDLICCSACVGSFSSQMIYKGKTDVAKKYLIKMKKIFGEDFYIEIQPYAVNEKGMQEKVNLGLIKLAKELNIKMILTSDSHRGRKEDMLTYLKMHEIAGHNIEEIKETYKDRYMPSPSEMYDRFLKMHCKDLGLEKTKKLGKEMYKNLDEIENKCEKNYLDSLPLVLPKLGKNSKEKIKNDIIQGLKDRGKYTKEYIKRCKEELEVINYHGFEDYFLIVADYVNYAKNRGICVGPGRGSVCNCLVAYALKITEVDSLFFNLDFRRFLRKDKKKFPDIDLDFETSRRQEIIEYLCSKYKGHASRICSYGLYKIDNLFNDLAKVCGVMTIDSKTGRQVIDKNTIKEIKEILFKYSLGNDIYLDKILSDKRGKELNETYDHIFEHFVKLYLKVRFIGTHAAGVAITGGNILDYAALKIDKNGNVFTNYDLEDIENLNVIKFDILGLKTMESIRNLREATNDIVDYNKISQDKNIIEQFRLGNTDGIFQFERDMPRSILNKIHCDCFEDIVAASSMNRPGPILLKQPAQYATNKENPELIKDKLWYEYTKETYGTIIYQEEVQQICHNLADMEWGDTDKVMKLLKSSPLENIESKIHNTGERPRLEKLFIEGIKKRGIGKEEALQIFDNMTSYTFNKGHAVGYSLVSIEEMYYKIYYPLEYWYSKLKFAMNEEEYSKFTHKAVVDGVVVFLPHINYSTSKTRIRKCEGEKCLQQGLSDIKGVGDKAAALISEERKKNGIFISYDNFIERCKGRIVTSRVVEKLIEQGALEFDKKIYISRVKKYNSTMYGKTFRDKKSTVRNSTGGAKLK